LIVVFFILAISILVAYMIIDSLQDAIETTPINESETAIDVVESGKNALLSFDSLFVFVFVGICGAVIMGAFMIYTHPIFFAISIFILVILSILGAIFSNIYVDVATTSAFTGAELMYPMMATIMRNLPFIMIAMAFAILVAMYGKSTVGGVSER